MKIQDLRVTLNMSQRSFAEKFGIPLGTLRNWEQGISSPPEYVFQMIFRIIRRDDMINVETIKFVKILDKLARLSKNGIEPFENATEKNFDKKLFYVLRNFENGNEYKVVLDAILLDGDHEVCSYYGEDGVYKVKAIIDEGVFIIVDLLESREQIIIEDGEWYFA